MNAIRNSAKAIIIVDMSLLTIKNHDEEGFWYILPGGGQHSGETLTDALQRECREELSVDVIVGDLVCLREYIGRNHEFEKDAKVHQIEFMFACSLQDGTSVGAGEQPDQWSASSLPSSSAGGRAVARPALMGLFSLVTLVAHEHYRHQTTHLAPVQVAAWYKKTTPTFSDALALVRRHLWTQTTFPTSPGNFDIEKVPRALLTQLANLLCYAA
ncbi:MAG: NUDIX domain-containing protein [Ktedonobacterales bacterium]